MTHPLLLTDVVLRDAHQSLLATRLRLDDMLPIAAKLDQVGYWSLETWGGATFDACIRYLGEDPWQRLRALKQAMPNTRQQMLLRGQNLLGYRHYADDVVDAFVERAHLNGMDLFRIFDALNDIRNFERAVKAVVAVGAHAQGTLSYTTSPVHNLQTGVDLARRLEDLGCHSICIKDMAGLLKPYEAEALIRRLKATVKLPLALHCHATTGLSLATQMKAIDAGIDMLDTAISSMSMTYGHSPTETVVAMLAGSGRDTGLNIHLLEEIAVYFRQVRKKYAQFEGSLKGVDSRILVAQVPGGMLTNMEAQLKEQHALDKMDAVLAEIPRVREDLGFLPLVTPTSQIVGSQAVLNVLVGERYKTITKETASVLRGEYGQTPAPVNVALQQQVLAAGEQPITCRPADLLAPELGSLQQQLLERAAAEQIPLAAEVIDDVLTYALFPQVGLKFLKNRHNPQAFEPAPQLEVAKDSPQPVASNLASHQASSGRYAVRVDGRLFNVEVAEEGALNVQLAPAPALQTAPPATSAVAQQLQAPLAGTIFKLLVQVGQEVAADEPVLVLEAMKMESEIRALNGGVVAEIWVHEGDQVVVGQPLIGLTQTAK